MSIQAKIATVFGGTGFVGRHIVRALCRAGYTVRVASRTPSAAYFLRPLGDVGQVVPVFYDPRDPSTMHAALHGADACVIAVGILAENRKNRFARIHVTLPEMIAKSAAAAGVKRLVHISALSIDEMTSVYAQTKRAGEAAIRAAFPDATFLRPSVIFGPEDSFFNRFAGLAALLPFLPIVGGHKTLFQPVYVGDVALCAVRALDHPRATFELGGPEILDFNAIYNRIFALTKRPRPLITLPLPVARLQAALFALLPSPPLTGDQITSLQTDSVVHAGALTMRDLGIAPHAIDSILPSYLSRFRDGGPFAKDVA